MFAALDQHEEETRGEFKNVENKDPNIVLVDVNSHKQDRLQAHRNNNGLNKGSTKSS